MNIVFMTVLGLSLLVDLALGAWAGANFPQFAKTWGLTEVGAASTAHFLGWVLATCLIGFAAIQGVAIHWTRRDKNEGAQLAVVFGCWLILSSLATFAFASAHGSSGFASMGWKFLLVDGLRGAVLTVSGFLALRAPSVVRELRLPDGATPSRRREERHELPRRERGHDRPRRREGGREGREEGRRRPDRPAARGRDDQRDGRHVERGREGRGRDDRGRESRRRDEAAPGAADPESRTVAEARRSSPTLSDRPLTVVVKGAPERIRALAADEVPLVVDRPPAGAGSQSVGSDDPSGRRRRRRRRRGGAGSNQALEGASASSSYDDLDDPVVIERDIEERSEDESGEGQEGASAVRGFSGGRRRSSPAPASRPDAETRTEEEEQPSRHHASPVEALDMLRLLEPEERRASSSPAAESGAYGRNRRPAGHRTRGPSRLPDDD